MKNQLTLFLSFLSFFQLLSQEPNNILGLETRVDSMYYNITEPRDGDSYILENKLREQVLTKYTDTLSQKYKMSLAKKHASEALFLMEREHDYKAAIAASKKALNILKTIEKQDLILKGRIYHFLHLQYKYNSDLVMALSMIKKSRDVLMDTLVSNHKLVADAEFYIGYASGSVADRDTEIKQYMIAKAKYTSFLGRNSYDVAEKCMHLATVYGFIGYYKMELDSYLEAIEIWETIDYRDKSYQAIAYGNVSTWYLWHGDYDKAEQYLIKKENLIAQHKKEGGLWYNETFLGRTKLSTLRKYAELNYYQGNLEQALKINDEILDFLLSYDVSDPNNDPNNFGLSRINPWIKFQTIRALRLKGDIIKKVDPNQAKNLHEQALQIININRLLESPLPDFMYLGNYYLEKEDLGNANKIWNESVTQAKQRADEYALIQLYAKQAEIAKRQDSIMLMNDIYERVFKLLQKEGAESIDIKDLGYKDCKPYGNVPIINTILEVAENYVALFEESNNASYLENASQLGSLASDMFSKNNRDFKYNDKSYSTISKINEQLLSTSLLYDGEGRLKHILQNIEQSKSRQVWKAFLGSNERKNLNIPDSIIEKEKNLKAELHYYKRVLFIENKGDSVKNMLWKEKILDVEKAIDTLDIWHQKKYPSYYNQTKKEFDLKTLQRKLTKKQLLVNYVFAANNVYAFILSKNKIELIHIGKKEKVEQLVQDFIKELNDKTRNKYLEIAHKLYLKLLPKSIQLEGKKELIIVPSELLYYLPFEILIDTDNSYLIQNHALSYTPSLLLYQEQTEVRTTKKNKLGVFAPSYLVKNKNAPDRNSPVKLKGAVSEAKTISRLFDGDFFTGKLLNKKLFMEKAKDYNMLHLAMHANLNNVASEFSNLDFSSETENDKLFISELYGINVNADLAVLSACNTGMGIINKGEGITNISRAFTYAGVPSTVTSLWQVPDKQTSQIMVSFYRYLKEGEAKNIALQKAKLDYLGTTKDELLKHPYYWAGFVVTGNISPIQENSSLWWVLLLLLVFGIFTWYLRNKKSV